MIEKYVGHYEKGDICMNEVVHEMMRIVTEENVEGISKVFPMIFAEVAIKAVECRNGSVTARPGGYRCTSEEAQKKLEERFEKEDADFARGVQVVVKFVERDQHEKINNH